MTTIKVYVSCERGDDIEMRSPVFEITKKEYDHYWSDDGGDDQQYWPVEWLEFEDDIIENGSSCLELYEDTAE
jgi:hypothetical protein